MGIEFHEAIPMTLIHRISQLFTADLHAVLDRLEEPEALLKQAIRDMEELVAKTEQRVRLLEHGVSELDRRRQSIEQSTAGIDGELDLCLAQGEDALARSLVRRKLEAERALRAVATRHEDDTRQLAEQRALLDEQRRELDVVRQKAELFVGPSREPPSFASEQPVSNDDVEVALLRERERRKPS